MSVKIVKPEEVDPAYGKLIKERDQLKEEEGRLRSKLAGLQGQTREDAPAGRLTTSDRLNEIRDRQSALGRERPAARRRACQAAAEALVANGDFCNAVTEAADDLAAQLEKWVELYHVDREARRVGVSLPPLPPFVQTQFAEATLWVCAQLKSGALMAEILPNVLRDLIEGVS